MAASHWQGNGHLKFISNSPHFFKIILQDTIQRGKLEIPRKFVKNYGNDMSSPAILRVPTGALWKVELAKFDGRIWLKNGWKEFSNHYSLEIGHFLVFRYEGKFKFHVFIFDRGASEIEYPYTINNHRLSEEIPDQNSGESEDDESIHIIDEISPSRKMREKQELSCPRPAKMMRSTDSATKIEGNVKVETLAPPSRHSGCLSRKGDKNTSYPRIRRLGVGEKAKALERATSAFKSENPFFLVFMQPTYVGLGRKCAVALPTNFVTKHLKKEQCNVILCNSNGKTWTVSYVRGRKFYGTLQAGWKTFVEDNFIQVGDVCAFELINCVEISFKVVIYKNQNAYRHQSVASTNVSCPVKKKAPASYARKGYPEQSNSIKKAKTSQIARAFTSEKPFFVIVLQPSYVHLNKVSIPENFARKYFAKMREDVTLHLSNGKSWPVKYQLFSLERPSAKFYSGWRIFVLDNNLEVGDICLFELIEGTQTSFKVTIYKKQVVEDGNSGSSSADKSKENQVEIQESLMVNTETDRVTDKGDMSSLLHNQHSSEEVPVPKIMENNRDASVLLQEPYEEKSLSLTKALEEASQGYQTLQENEAMQVQGVSQEPLGLTPQSPIVPNEKASVPPSFRKVVLPIHLKEKRMDIPFRFFEQYFEPNIQKLILQVADRSWPVKITSNLRYRVAKLTSGWIEFARENFLKEGDICVYEVDTVGNDSLKVSILKFGH